MTWEPPTSPEPAKAETLTRRPEQWVALVAGALAFVGALLPWASITTGFGTISKSGTEGDGVITLLLGICGGAAGFIGGRWLTASALCGLAIGGIGVWDYSDVSDDITVGGGLYLTIISGVVMFAAAMTVWDKQRRAAKGWPT